MSNQYITPKGLFDIFVDEFAKEMDRDKAKALLADYTAQIPLMHLSGLLPWHERSKMYDGIVKHLMEGELK